MSSILRREESSPSPLTATSDAGWRREWIESFGSRWYIDAAVMAAVVFCFGAVRPLADPDLPMHLAVGEWIVRHRAVPLTEPFAWTRQGSPYYAYSWLQQTTYYELLRVFGHLGLRALQGVLVLCSAAAMVVLARAARWRPSHAVILAGLNLIVGSLFIGYLRPQSILLTTIPLIWAGVHLLDRDEHPGLGALVMFLASAITANSHLFFPLTIAPTAIFWARPPARPRTWLVGVLAVMLGWVASPYAIHWVGVFRHNFGPNVLLRPPAAITELQPGFVTMLYPAPKPMVAAVVLMLALPWALRTAPMRPRERLLAAVYWGMGLVLFGYATRFFVAWWLLALPFIGRAIVGMTRESVDAPPRPGFRLFGLVACLVILGTELAKTRALWAMEGDTVRRTLPTAGALPAQRLASTLEERGGGTRPGRMMSTFSFGSYLTWRLPRLSQSIDSRGTFPDSVAAAEAVVLGSDRDVPLGPWQSAELAMVPLRYRVAAVLDTATGWQRIATTPGEPIPLDSVGLWVRRDWWGRVGREQRGAASARRFLIVTGEAGRQTPDAR